MADSALYTFLPIELGVILKINQSTYVHFDIEFSFCVHGWLVPPGARPAMAHRRSAPSTERKLI